MIKAVIFDCFGVVFEDNFGPVYEHFGGDLNKDKEFISKVMHESSTGRLDSGMQQIVDHLGISSQQWNEVRMTMDNSGFNEELLAYTKKLRENYKVGMLSNVGSSGLENYMDYAVLEKHFEVIVESAKIGFAKPEARAYEITAEKLGVRLDECLFVDDREEYIEGAQHVGMQTVLYTDFESFKLYLERITE
jgi:putative hydrolase of the HAD superfamily